MHKILFVSNIAGKKGVDNFVSASLIAAKQLGLEFHTAVNYNSVPADIMKEDAEKYGVFLHHIDFNRKPLSLSNIRAYQELVKLIRTENIEYIHCNTPVGGLIGRLAAKKCKVKKVIYQAHGFHFFKGAPLINWLVYYPIEKWLACYTDVLITINSEDFELAKNKLKLRKHGKVYYVHGVGIDTAQYDFIGRFREEKRTELKLDVNDVALVSMGDLIERKNYGTAIRAVAEAKNPNLQYYICGKGPEKENLKALAENLGVEGQIHFLGFCSNIKELLAAADIFLFTTKQEGLPRSMMEAMASGLPCVASKIRGNTNLLEGTEGGYLCETTDVSAYAEALNLIANDGVLREQMSRFNKNKIKEFDKSVVEKEMCSIYADVLEK